MRDRPHDPVASLFVSPARWQATGRPPGSGRNAGVSSRHSGWASGQRGWKRQPADGSIGLGGSPVTATRTWPRLCGEGTAASKAWVRDGAAWQTFRDDELGSIEPNKLADFAVLSANPLDDPEGIKDIEVEATITEGRTIYSRDGSAAGP